MRLPNLTEERKKEAGSSWGVEFEALANPDSRIDFAPVARAAAHEVDANRASYRR